MMNIFFRTAFRSGRRTLLTAMFSLFACLISNPVQAQTGPPPTPKPQPDVIVFKNGDQLTGKLVRGIGNSLFFKSDVAGEVTVSLDKVKELRSEGSFIVVTKDEKVERKAVKEIRQVAVRDGVVFAGTAGEEEKTAAKNPAYIVDEDTFNKDVTSNPGPFRGWTGTITGGATNVQGTEFGETYIAGIALIRAIPTAPFLPPRTRTVYNLSETYGKLTQPVIPPPPAGSDLPTKNVATTSIFHTDFQHNKYFTPRIYALGLFAFDHNLSQGMSLQQTYGAGVGGTVIQNTVQQLDLMGDVNYQRLNYIAVIPPEDSLPNADLIGVSFGETYKRALPMKSTLSQTLNYTQPLNTPSKYQASGAILYSVPVYHNLGVSTSASDSFLNVPQHGYKKNSFQFVLGVTYNLR